jgi:tRNA pseudouridine65 synthase
MSGLDFIRFLHEDEHFFVVAKPAKIAVHPSDMCRDRRTLLCLVRNKGGGEHVYPVHRLDKPVGGPVLFARSPQMATVLQQQFIENRVSKNYVTLVRGWTEDRGAIDHQLKKENGQMQDCRTEYQCLARVALDEPFGKYSSIRYSLLKCHPITGRFHQLRRHLRDIAHPIIGDTTDGDSHQNKFFRERFGVRRLMLHCTSLGFDHPITGERVVCELIPDAEFFKPLARLGIQGNLLKNM